MPPHGRGRSVVAGADGAIGRFQRRQANVLDPANVEVIEPRR